MRSESSSPLSGMAMAIAVAPLVLKSGANGLALDGAGATGNADDTRLVAASGGTSRQWEVIPSSDG